jgi:O-antigen/teichoic acid export membrane protein
VLQALVVTLVLGGLGAQHQALLQRGMRFGVLAWISAATALAAAAVSLLLAWRGAGYWALVAGTVAGSLAGTALSWIACGWRPGLPRRRVGTGPAIRFGLHMLGFGVLGFLARNLHNLLIGRAWGAAAAGLYSRAYGIGTQMNHAVLQPLGLVAPPAMAGMEPGRYRRYYETACTITVMATMPILFACLVLPGELVRVLLGSQWDEAATPLRLLAPGFLPQALMFTTGWVYLSAGNSQAMMRWGLLGWSGMIAATVVGVPYGLGGVALASTLASYILVWPCLLLAFRDTPLTARGVIAAVRNPVLAGLLAAGVAAGVLAMVPAQSALDRLLAGCGAFAAVDLLLLWTVMGQGPLLRQVLSQLRSATGRA